MRPFIYIISASILGLSGCYYDVQEELYPLLPTTNCDTSVITFAQRIQPMMNANCAYSGCHVSGGQSPDLSNYTGIKNNTNRIQARAISDKTMPPSGPLSPCDIKALQAWINGGSVNN